VQQCAVAFPRNDSHYTRKTVPRHRTLRVTDDEQCVRSCLRQSLLQLQVARFPLLILSLDCKLYDSFRVILGLSLAAQNGTRMQRATVSEYFADVSSTDDFLCKRPADKNPFQNIARIVIKAKNSPGPGFTALIHKESCACGV
jgi:hypothetical protein